MIRRPLIVRMRDICPGTGKARVYSWRATAGCATRQQAEAMAARLWPRATILPAITRKGVRT